MTAQPRAHASSVPTHEELISAVPIAPDFSIDWDKIHSLIPDFTERMRVCPQDPVHHAEGDVLTHTRMVVESLISDRVWQDMRHEPEGDIQWDDHSSQERQTILFWAAVLHDIGKPECTVHEEDGRITSKGHSRIGTQMARRFLWQTGSPFKWREALCGIIQCHQLPFWLLERENAEQMAVETSYICNTEDLCLHAKHDALGRHCEDKDAILQNVELTRIFFYEIDALGNQRPFANSASRIEYLTREDRYLDYKAHEDYKCTATMLSGLPGAGKDTYARDRHHTVISLDDIRAEMGISPTNNQGAVIQAAKEKAREYLRAGKDFTWNATNITRNMREPLLSLFRSYGAKTRIIYIEPDPQTHRDQNRNRDAAVPDDVIRKLVRKLEPPTRAEAHHVTWITPTTSYEVD